MSDTDKPQPDDKPDAATEAPRTPEVDATEDASAAADPDARSRSLLREIASGDALAGVLAVFLAVFVGSVMIAATNEGVRETATYITARPSDFFNALWEAISGAYSAMFRGAIFNYNLTEPAQQWRPLTETLKFAGPLIAGGLGVGIAFRAGMFNIGGRGQMLMAGGAAGWVGFELDLPTIIHLPLAILVGMVVGALWGGIAGLLKARTGAHEVIVTIMLNYVAYYLLFYALSRQFLLQAPGSANPKSLPMKETAILPKVLGDQFNLHLGFVLALVAVAFAWWLLSRSTLGYRIRAVGENPHAARASGINVGKTYTIVMLIAGSLLGLAGVNQVLGTVTSGVSLDLDASIGFDAITVALLGRSRPFGILAAGLLFGALKAGGFTMQTSENISVDLVLVVQSLIVLFLAAPPLVRAIFRLPAQEAK
ncbi:simple sugar transport system permease protein [Nocardioides alpinus]|uniref:ABC transporter permease n=1 Tax=Nocardioides alpinus TaxID=748909 RepID=A0A1I1AFI0_9ACTN|nr:ABC transporter permease [Nocardioides alpinus]PKH43479.1 ABC transporter permease [Nocardioides alpinus]SFB35258.1 simple sugar transport system permease protein [Nocardioides alpinus]